tara:strand:- start:603 stop:890 length:288 start_codon:yes stop_codon:yes gene_type:complete
MKVVFYNLQIKIFKDEYKTFNKLRTKDIAKTLQDELLRIHDIQYKCSKDNIYNLINRPQCVNRLIRHYVKLEYWKNPEQQQQEQQEEINRNTTQN